MRTRVLIAVFFLLGAGTMPAAADTIDFSAGLPPGWTVATGSGGTSPATLGIAPTNGLQFAWIDTRFGGVDMASVTGIPYATNGEVLLSPTLQVGSNLSMDLNFLTSDGDGRVDFAEAFLVQPGCTVGSLASCTPVAKVFGAQTHAALDPACTNHVLDDPTLGACGPDDALGVSGGVTLTPYSMTSGFGSPCPDNPSTACLDGLLTGPLPDGQTFGPCEWNDPGCPDDHGNGGSSGWVMSDYSNPNPGNYQLEFLVSNAFDSSVQSGLAVDNISGVTAPVPEPGAPTLILIELAGLAGAALWQGFHRIHSA